MKHAVEAHARNAASLSPLQPILGLVIAIAVTATMDGSGFSNFSAFALLPLMFLFWYLERLSSAEMGFRWGSPTHYTVALLCPLMVLGIVAIVAMLAGAVDLSNTNWQKVLLNVLIVTISTALVAVVTEEGFFRGLFVHFRVLRISAPEEVRELLEREPNMKSVP